MEETKFRILIWAGHVARIGEGRSTFKILTSQPTEKRPSRSLRHRWEVNTTMDLKEIGINTSNWLDSVYDMVYWRALVNVALNLLVT